MPLRPLGRRSLGQVRWLVSGAAGAGKTGPVAEVAARAGAAGAAVLWAGCHEADRSLFLQPVLDALRSVLDGMTAERLNTLAGPWAGTLTELMPELRGAPAAPGR